MKLVDQGCLHFSFVLYEVALQTASRNLRTKPLTALAARRFTLAQTCTEGRGSTAETRAGTRHRWNCGCVCTHERMRVRDVHMVRRLRKNCKSIN